ncbi:MAG: MOSC domain-containing protein [Myxococcaceae bacterium]
MSDPAAALQRAALAELEAGLPHVRAAPATDGRLELIVRRPAELLRETLAAAELTAEHGLVGDNWRVRGSRHTADRSAEPNKQITVINSRCAALFAHSRERWPLAGDQLYVDFDLSFANLPIGARFSVGNIVLEVSPEPHLGCGKFADRFGVDALKFVNSKVGRELRLRGLNARVISGGSVKVGDAVKKLV